MAIDDDGELIVIAPALKEFGEDKEIDRLIRKYGYFRHATDVESLWRKRGTGVIWAQQLTLSTALPKAVPALPIVPGKGNDNLTVAEIESVGFNYADIDEITSKYDPAKLRDGLLPCPMEKKYFVSNPALGL